VGGILGLSRIIIVSPESISMISEACSAGRYIIVFKSKIDSRHDLFLKYMSRKGYIYLCDALEIFAVINNIRKSSPAINKLRDYETVRGKLEKIL
jgi:mitochondrial fission protein ELM1